MTRLPWPLVFQVVGVLAALWFIVHTWQIWMLVFTAMIVAAAILPAARFGERYRVPTGLTVVGVYLGAAAVLALMGRLLWPAIREQWGQFRDQLPRLIQNLQRVLDRLDVLGWSAAVPAPNAEQLQNLTGTLLANTASSWACWPSSSSRPTW
jgi:predicted PurR-regulated permease PerM